MLCDYAMSTVNGLERHQIAIYLGGPAAGAALGLAWPASSHPLELGIYPVLGALLYATFLQVPFTELAGAFRDVRFLSAAPLLNFVERAALVAHRDRRRTCRARTLLVAGRNLNLARPVPAPGRGPGGQPRHHGGLRSSYAVASLGCTIGPFLVVTAATFRAGSTLDGVAAYATCALGMGLVVGVLAVGAALMTKAAAGNMRRLVPHLARLSGVLLVLAGAYVGWYELRVYSGGSTDDSIVSTASDLQSQLAAWVDKVGPTVFAASLAVLIRAAVAARMIVHRRAVRSSPAAPADPPEQF